MLILLEGPDGGGKSTLAATISQHAEEAGVPAAIRHTGPPNPPKRCPFTEYESELDWDDCAAAHDPGRLLILDRHHTGEQVYGPIFRGQSRLTDNGMYHIELALEAMGCVKLMVVPPLSTVMERLKQRRGSDLLSSYDKAFLDIHKLDEVLSWYIKYAYLNRYDVVEDGKVVMDLLFKRLRFRSQVATSSRELSGGTYIGSLAPRLLICGDVRGDGRFGRKDLTRPFTPTTKGGSSNYLLNAVKDSIVRHRCGIINVNEPHVNVPELYTTLGWPCVVALGERASATLRYHHIRHEKVPHPSWANRFRHDGLDWYAARLADAAETGRTRRDDIHLRQREQALPVAD